MTIRPSEKMVREVQLMKRKRVDKRVENGRPPGVKNPPTLLAAMTNEVEFPDHKPSLRNAGREGEHVVNKIHRKRVVRGRVNVCQRETLPRGCTGKGDREKADSKEETREKEEGS